MYWFADSSVSIFRSPSDHILLLPSYYPSATIVFNSSKNTTQMDIVIRATVLEDVHKYSSAQRSILSRIMDLIEKRSIHIPSPLRLLKLANAKRCERGSGCFALDLKTGLASKSEMGYLRPYGFAICGTCSNDCSVRKPRQWRWNHWTRQESRLVQHSWSRKVFNPDKGSDLCIGTDGENLGPLLNAKHVQLIYAAHPHNGDEQKKLFDAFLNECGEGGSDELEAFERARVDMVQIHEEAEDECAKRREQYYAKRREDYKTKNDARVAAKRANLEPILVALEEALADTPLKELVLDYEWKNDASFPLLQFKYFFAKDSMYTLVAAPSSATRKKTKAVFSNLRRKLEILSAVSQSEDEDGDANGDFFSFSFLSAAQEEYPSPLKKRALQKMLDYCSAKFSGGMKAVIGSNHNNPWNRSNPDLNGTSDRFFDLLEGGPENFVDAGKVLASFPFLFCCEL